MLRFNNYLNKIELKKLTILQGIFTVLIFVIVILPIRNLDQILYTTDEFIYWGQAEKIIGNDWTQFFNAANSLCYSFIILPIIMLVKNQGIAFKILVLMNGIFLSCSYLVSLKVSKKLMQDSNDYFRTALCFCASCYPAFIINARRTIPNTLIVLLVWLILLNLFEILKKPTKKKIIVLALLATWVISLDAEFISLAIAILLFLVIMLKKRRLSIEIVLMYFIIFSALVVVSFKTEQIILDYLFDYDNVSFLQKYKEMYGVFCENFKNLGFKYLLYSLIGKVYYIGITTFLFVFFGLYHLIKKVAENFKKNDNVANDMFTFLIIEFCLALLASSLINIKITDISSVINGKLLDIIIAPFIITSISQIIKISKMKTKFLVSIFMMFIFSFVVAYAYSITSNLSYTPMDSVSFSFFSITSNDILIIPYLGTLYCLMISAVIMIGLKLPSIYISINNRIKLKNKVRINKNILTFLGLFLLVIIWLSQIETISNKYLTSRNDEYQNNIRPITELLKSMDYQKDIYYFNDTVNNEDNLTFLQYLAPTLSIKSINTDTIEQYMEGSIEQEEEDQSILNYLNEKENYLYIVDTNSDHSNLIRQDYRVVYSTDSFALLAVKGSDLESALSLQLSGIQYGIEKSSIISDNKDSNEDIFYESNGNEGYLIRCPIANSDNTNGTYESDLTLDEGTYILQVSFELEYAESEKIGYVEVCFNGKSYANRIYLEKADFSDNKLSFSVPFSSDEEMSDVQFNIYIYEGNRVKAFIPTYKKVSTNYVLGLDNVKKAKKIVGTYYGIKEMMQSDSTVAFLDDGTRGDDFNDLSYFKKILPGISRESRDVEEINEDFLICYKSSKLYYELLDKYTIYAKNSVYLLLVKSDSDAAYAAEQDGLEAFNNKEKISYSYYLSSAEDEDDYQMPINVPSGNYEMNFDFQWVDKKYYDMYSSDTLIGTIIIENGDTIYGSKEIKISDFNQSNLKVSVPFGDNSNMKDITYKIEFNKNFEFADFEVKSIHITPVSSTFNLGVGDTEDMSKILNIMKEAGIKGKVWVPVKNDNQLDTISIEYISNLLQGFDVKKISYKNILDLKTESYLVTYEKTEYLNNLLSKYTMIANYGDYTLWAYTNSHIMEKCVSQGIMPLSSGQKVKSKWYMANDINNFNNLKLDIPSGSYVVTVVVKKENLLKDDLGTINIVSTPPEDSEEDSTNSIVENIIGTATINESDFGEGDTAYIPVNISYKQKIIDLRVDIDWDNGSDTENEILWIEKK